MQNIFIETKGKKFHHHNRSQDSDKLRRLWENLPTAKHSRYPAL